MSLVAIDLDRLLDELLRLEWVLLNAGTIEPELHWRRARAHVKRIRAILPRDLDLVANLDLGEVERLVNLVEEIEWCHELGQDDGLLDVPADTNCLTRLRRMIKAVAVALDKRTPAPLRIYQPDTGSTNGDVPNGQDGNSAEHSDKFSDMEKNPRPIPVPDTAGFPELWKRHCEAVEAGEDLNVSQAIREVASEHKGASRAALEKAFYRYLAKYRTSG